MKKKEKIQIPPKRTRQTGRVFFLSFKGFQSVSTGFHFKSENVCNKRLKKIERIILFKNNTH